MLLTIDLQKKLLALVKTSHFYAVLHVLHLLKKLPNSEKASILLFKVIYYLFINPNGIIFVQI